MFGVSNFLQCYFSFFWEFDLIQQERPSLCKSFYFYQLVLVKTSSKCLRLFESQTFNL